MASRASDEEDTKKALALSLESNNEDHEKRATLPTSKSANGILGLDRKAMEQERLARQNARKRERSVSPPPFRGTRKAPKLEETTTTSPSGARLTSFATAVQQDQTSRKPSIANTANERLKNATAPSNLEQQSARGIETPSSDPSLKYPHGAIKKTWAFGHERSNDIKLEEVLEPLSVKTAVLSAFQWDVDWVLSKLRTPLNGGSTKCIFIMQAKEKADQDKWREQANYMASFLRLTFPNMSGQIWCMHSKLMLLFHPKKLRLAIPTANLLNFDWGETGQMENSVFLIDLPRLASSQKVNIEDLTIFGQELMFFLEKQNLDQDVRDAVLGFDFAATKDMAFVHTAGGYHYRDTAARTGLYGLSQAVQKLNLGTEHLEIDFAASSIGQLNEKYLHDFYSAAKGVDLLSQARAARSKAGADFFKKKSKNDTIPPSGTAVVREKMRVYFPTQETVRASKAGAAGTICLQRKYFEATTFPKDCFRDYKSNRSGLLSHNKILCARGNRGGSPIAWIYVGSANMSKSAWGELPKERTENKINCRNWECGVLLPVPADKLSGVSVNDSDKSGESSTRQKVRDEQVDSETESEAEDEDAVATALSLSAVPPMEVFKDLIDLPFEVPGDRYNGREPWYFTE